MSVELKKSTLDERKLVNLLKSQAWLYMEAVRQALANDEAAGERAIRSWLRSWGHWRGAEMRKGHWSMGWPIDMESVIKRYDGGSTYHMADEWSGSAKFSPNCSVTPIAGIEFCYHAQVWQDNDFWRWGHVLCDEYHHSMVSSYRPGGCVVIPINLMKRDDRCEFLWVCPGSGEETDDSREGRSGMSEQELAYYRRLWASDTREEATACSMARTEQAGAGLWFFICRELEKLMPTAWEDGARRALVAASVARGRALRELHEEVGLDISPWAFLEHYDQTFSPLSSAEVERNGNRAVATVTSCPMDDVWSSVDGRRFGRIYCEDSYRSALSSYLPGASLHVMHARSRGDAECRLMVTL